MCLTDISHRLIEKSMWKSGYHGILPTTRVNHKRALICCRNNDVSKVRCVVCFPFRLKYLASFLSLVSGSYFFHLQTCIPN